VKKDGIGKILLNLSEEAVQRRAWGVMGKGTPGSSQVRKNAVRAKRRGGVYHEYRLGSAPGAS